MYTFLIFAVFLIFGKSIVKTESILHHGNMLSRNNFKEIQTKNEELTKRAFEALRKKSENFDYFSESDLYKDLLKKSVFNKRAFEALGKRNNYISFTETLDNKQKISTEEAAHHNKLDLFERLQEHFSNKRAFEALGKRNNKPLDDALDIISEDSKEKINKIPEETLDKRAFEALGRK